MSESESTETSLDEITEEHYCNNPTRDILAEGIVTTFKSPVDILAKRVNSLRTFQSALEKQFSIVDATLNQIHDLQSSFPDLSFQIQKVVNIKAKATVIANIMLNNQTRLQRLHEIVERQKRKPNYPYQK